MTQYTRYASMREAYNKVYQEQVQENVTVMPGMMRPVVAVKKNTTLNLEINPETKGPGEVKQAYYTFPAGFDPINRQDITYGGDKKPQNEETEHDIELVGDYLLENGYVETPEGVDAFYQHMSERWIKEIVEGKNRCWTGYKPVKGKKAYSPGSCEKA